MKDINGNDIGEGDIVQVSDGAIGVVVKIDDTKQSAGLSICPVMNVTGVECTILVKAVQPG